MTPDIYRIEDALRRIDKLNGDCARNMQALNQMILELKGLIGIVRAKEKDTRPGMDWYKEEIVSTGFTLEPKRITISSGGKDCKIQIGNPED